MADRSGKRRFRIFLQTIVLATLAFLLWRTLGPSLVVVRESAVAPILQEGDVVWVRPARDTVQVGEIVLIPTGLGSRFPGNGVLDSVLPWRTGSSTGDGAASTSPDQYTVRLVVATPGDRVSWTLNHLTVRRESGPPDRYELPPIHHLLDQPARGTTIPAGRLFLLGFTPGVRDSRIRNATDADEIQYRAVRVLWPPERRVPLDPEQILPTVLRAYGPSGD